MDWRPYLRSRTRSPEFLWRMSLGILLAGAVLGFFAQWILARSATSDLQQLAMAAVQGSPDEALGTLEKMLTDHHVRVDELFDALVVLSHRLRAPKDDTGQPLVVTVARPIDRQEVTDRLAASFLDEETKTAATILWQSLADGKLSEELTKLADRSPAVRYANLAVGEFWDADGSPLRRRGV